MFKHVGRRLAILNTVIVIALIAALGGLTYAALSRSLRQEVDQALEERISAVIPSSLQGDDSHHAVALDEDEDDEEEEDEDDDDEDREIVSSGDTILFLVDRDGHIVDNPRDIDLDDLPVIAGVEAAFDGKIDVRSVELADDAHMRVMTVPVTDDDRVIGAIQALRNLDEHEEQLAIIRNMTLLGVGLGIIVAGPAGYFLSRRAMVPINAAFSRQRAFVADASHELRTPLTLIRAHAEYAARKPERPVSEIQPSLDSIIAEVDRVSTMVTDLLTLARLDAGKLVLNRSSHDLVGIAGAAAESMRPIAEHAGVSMTVESSNPVAADVDPARIEQVVRILLDNALRHTPAGGRVTVTISATENWREIVVQDTGSGIAADELPHVFERFSRSDRGRNRERGGTGLGLAIARGLIEEHGGTIAITSEVGHGATVTIRVPEHSR